MCLSVPGKIISIKDGIAKVQYAQEIREAAALEGTFEVGDYVIVQGKICVQKVPESEAKGFFDLISEQ